MGEGRGMQMQAVGPNAKICVKAESRTLTNNGDGTWSLRNGSFMRKFLDGYYPLRMSMRIRYSDQVVHYLQSEPSAQPGFSVTQNPGEVLVDASIPNSPLLPFAAWASDRCASESATRRTNPPSGTACSSRPRSFR